MYLVGSFVLVSLAGCGRGFFQSAEREPWRAEAEVACLKSGAVKESARTGPDRPDFRSRRVRRGISAEGRGARRKHRQLRICRRKPAAARQYRQSAALADYARAGGGSAPRKLSGKLSGNHQEAIRIRRRASRTMPRRRTARSRCPRRASPRRRMTSICRPKARLPSRGGSYMARTVLSAARPLPGAFICAVSAAILFATPPATPAVPPARARAGQSRQRRSGRSR